MKNELRIVHSTSLAADIEEAVRLEAQIEVAQARLDELKATLREHAADQTVGFSSPVGVAKVTQVQPTITIVKGMNPLILKKMLKEPFFSSLFIEEVKVNHAGFAQTIGILNAKQRYAVDVMTFSRPNSARVSLP